MRLKGLVHVLVGYSGYCRNLLGPVPDSNIKLQLDKHDQEVKELTKLRDLILLISKTTDGQDRSGLPTNAQTLTFITNMIDGQSAKYKKGNNPTQSAATPAANTADAGRGSKGPGMGDQKKG